MVNLPTTFAIYCGLDCKYSKRHGAVAGCPAQNVVLHISWILSLFDVSSETDVNNRTNYENESGNSPGADHGTKPTQTLSFLSTSAESFTTNKSIADQPRSSLDPHRSTTDQIKTTDQEQPTPKMPSNRSPERHTRDGNSNLPFDQEYWCSSMIGCGNMHVMCQYPEPGPGKNCKGYKEIPITDNDIFMMIHYFNYRRNLVAGGQEYRLPSASDMRMLEWDETLALFAQRWADQCIYDPFIFRDDTLLGTLTDLCRDLPGFDVAQVSTRIHGFNVSGAKLENMIHLLINTISSNFFNVTAHVVFSGYIPEDDYGAIALHSQAYLIGCGVASYLLNIKPYNHRMSVIYCNIGPLKDMYILDRYYKQGEPCSDCPSGTSCQPNSYFQFLCQRDSSLDNPREMKYSSYYNSESNLQPSSYFLHGLLVVLIFLLTKNEFHTV